MIKTPLLKRSGCVISTPPMKTLTVEGVAESFFSEVEVTVIQRPGLSVSILVPKASLRR
jgi:hypothetical protein